jgi:hypothetical protein
VSAIAAIIAFTLGGVLTARSDARKGELLSHNSGWAVWIITGLFFAAFLFFAVPGTPAAWTTLFIPVGYHLAARHILKVEQEKHRQELANRHWDR